ncbi:5-formyltetrahydrofolate cyclo-ligase [Vibrio ishigakensis]|uniref:5-formyltetrahydrofolate cyclo-ligase n=1 Tax=Vibrio ishigakensis TaxID=1481914 RepID=A0A0B8PRI1_9VIBR|nr:5-formyltetrahydrofolate cyclo-ligase [Vibrio ishigakensis]
MISSSRQQIRQQMRDMRNTLSSSFIDQASLHLKAHIAQLTELKSVKKVALYLANDGELNPMPSIEWLWQQGIDVYIPVLHPFSKGQLLFLHFTASTELVSNKYGISEPRLDVQNICL